MTDVDLIFNNAEKLAHASYKYLGKSITNCVIENTGGEIFTAGPTIDTLRRESENLKNRYGLMAGANYLVEGITNATDEQLDKNKDFMIDCLTQFSAEDPQNRHTAVKLTAFVAMNTVRHFTSV